MAETRDTTADGIETAVQALEAAGAPVTRETWGPDEGVTGTLEVKDCSTGETRKLNLAGGRVVKAPGLTGKPVKKRKGRKTIPDAGNDQGNGPLPRPLPNWGARSLWVKRAQEFQEATREMWEDGWELRAVVEEDRPQGKGWLTFWNKGFR